MTYSGASTCLYTLLRLHFLQEKDGYFVLAEDDLDPTQNR